MADFRMPSLGADMEYGTLVAWHVKPGDTVHRGDIIAEVETQKGVIDVDVYQSGIVEALVVEVGTRVPVGAVLARLRAPEIASAPAAAPSPPTLAPTQATPAPGVPPPSPPITQPAPPVAPVSAAAQPRLRTSPLARRMAAAHGIDVSSVHGTGLEGIVTSADIMRAIEARSAKAPTTVTPPTAAAPSAATRPPAPPPAAAAERLASMRQVIGAAMSRSHREIPHYYLSFDIDLAATVAWLTRENLARPVSERLLLAALFLKSVGLAARTVPEVNGFWTDGAFHPSAAVHLGVAISLRGGGLIAPAIHDADRLPLTQLMKALQDLVERARTGGLRSSELADSTITVTNLGDQGVNAAFGIIYPPQVALVGFGKVVERPWAKDGMVGVHPVVTVTLAADHRVSDGHRGGRFLAAIDRILQAPERL